MYYYYYYYYYYCAILNGPIRRLSKIKIHTFKN